MIVLKSNIPFRNLTDSTNAKKLTNNFRIVQGLVRNINDPSWYEDTECAQFEVEWAKRGQCRSLFTRLNDYFGDERERDKVLTNIVNHEELHRLVRLALFSSYFIHCIVLTRVITEDESAAFDIFDALNTTGEPLTALETLKPRVIAFEETKSRYTGSESEMALSTIDKGLGERYTDTSNKQSETKDLVVTFALYVEGGKLPRDLGAQRNFLRRGFDEAARHGDVAARRFTASLASVAEFRRLYWDKDKRGELGQFHGMDSLDDVQLLMSVISDMRTSLALPIVNKVLEQ